MSIWKSFLLRIIQQDISRKLLISSRKVPDCIVRF